MKNSYILSATTENALTAVERITIILARQRIPFEQMHVVKIDGQDFSTITIVLRAEQETIRRLIKRVERVVEVSEVLFHTQSKGGVHAKHEIRQR